MPGKIKVKVLAGRNLPVMDRASDTTDAFVEIKFVGVTHKTDVCRKSLNPHWNSAEWYRFEVDESELQDEPLQLRLMDHDTYSANDAIGKVVINLAPLLAREANNAKGTAQHGGAVLSGWIPVFDPMHGIRGELNVIVKVELFSDFNKYKTSSCGVQFFHCPMIPSGYRATSIHGFVEELVVNDDPEYQWIDKIRTPRASNEARQVAFIKLSNQVQRLIGLKAAELGANAVIGYQQDFDLEGEAGVVARAVGTAVSLVPLPTQSQTINIPPCTQQQLKKYLDILATDNESITDLNEYFQTHQDELQKLLNILHPTSSIVDDPDNVDDEDEKSIDLTRHPSVRSNAGDFSIYQDEYASNKSLRDISKDQTDLNKLLNRNDESDSDSSGPLKKIKKMKKNFFSKKLASIRKKPDKNIQDDQVSLKSNSSDASRMSIVEIGKEKLKLLKKPKFRKPFVNKEDEGEGMASILARSVIHAHTSLACITESQDSEHSPQSMRHTSESEPTINISEEVRPRVDSEILADANQNENKRKVPEIHFTSLNNISMDYGNVLATHRKLSESCPSTPSAERSDNLLKLPGEVGYFGSNLSALSGESSEIYSSSDEDDESSDLKTDTERTVETTSSVVQSVLSHDVNPAFIAQMEKKLSTLEFSTPEPDDRNRDDVILEENETENTSESTTIDNNNDEKIDVTSTNKPSTSTAKDSTSVSAKSNHHFKFHNPFSHKKESKSSSAPSSPLEKKSFVYRSSDRIKRHLSKLSKSSMIKSLSHISLIPKKKHVETKITLSQPGSASDVCSKAHSHETVLGSPFLSYTDLFNLDKEGLDSNKPHHKSDEFGRSKVSMYIGSEPASRASVCDPSSPGFLKEIHFDEQKSHRKDKSSINPTGLVHTAMETILMDKVQSLLIPTTPDNLTKERQFFDDVNEKLEQVNKQESLNSPKNSTIDIKPSGLIHTAIETMLLDKVQSLLIPTSPEHSTKEQSLEIKQADNQNPITDVAGDRVKKLVRQDSVHSVAEAEESHEMSKEAPNIVVPKVTRKTPVLQHFHPILSGAPRLETIPSESSVERSQSLDVEGFCGCKNECRCRECDTNSASVCGNSHAGWHVDRNEAKGDKSDKGDKGSPRHARHESYGGREPVGNTPQTQNSSLNSSSIPMQGIHRRSSDSDLSITPKGSSLSAAAGITGTGGGAILRPSMNSNNIEMLEYPFLTMTEYPPGFIVNLGGTVCARSVKLVDSGGESASRAPWWAELRTELRAHARALRCNAVIAYTETASICEDVCVLSASGTAAVINLENDFNDADAPISASNEIKSVNRSEECEMDPCSIAHVPYSPGSGPYRAELSTCGGCRRARVPAVLLATCAKPNRLISHAKAITLTAVAARVRRAPPTGEPAARDISDQLPFLEYELHKLLLAKLRMQGANALFSLQTQIAVGERCVMALASGTAVRLATLPPPTPPRIKALENDKEALEIQKALWDSFTANKAANGYDVVLEHSTNGVLPEVENEDTPVLDLCADKDACVLELDEAEDVETAKILALRRAHMPVYNNSLRTVPGAPPHAFAQVWRARLPLSGAGGASAAGERHVRKALEGVTYKLRRLQPYSVVTPRFQLDLSEDEIQLVVSGAAIRLQDPSKIEHNGVDKHNVAPTNGNHSNGDTDDDIFTLDEEQLLKQGHSEVEEKTSAIIGQVPTAVSLSTLSDMNGARLVRRLCALRLLFVRETTDVRECGGLSGFLHAFTCEVLAIVRAYTTALGGNALTSFYITQLMLQDNAHKNQGQCLLSVGGDVVHITY